METSEIFELLEKFDKSSLSEVIITKGDMRVTLRKPIVSGELPPAAQPLFAGSAAQPSAPGGGHAAVHGAAAGQTTGEEGEIVASPIVGTFYRAPSPDSPPFVEPGNRVAKGQTLCVIEAMKVMNELEAEFDCEILDVLVENGTMIEFGTPLFTVKR